MPKLSQYISPVKQKQDVLAGKAATPTQRQEESGTSTSQECRKLAADYTRRANLHGARKFRWPDGSLRLEPPPPNPYAVANRRQWAALVQHCRMTGGHMGIQRTGRSVRYGVAVPHAEHADCLRGIGLEPETDASGTWRGYDPERERPLRDEAHPFNTVYRETVARVLTHNRGRIMNNLQ